MKKAIQQDSTSSLARSVLIVDDSRESRGVLRSVLESRGMRILEADGEATALEVVRKHHPAVTVVDVDVTNNRGQVSRLQELNDCESTSLVVLGTTRQFGLSVPEERILSKPYHYGPLVRTIEQLLDGVRTT